MVNLSVFSANLIINVLKTYKQHLHGKSSFNSNTSIWNIYTMRYRSAFKKKEILVFAATLMNLEDFILSEIGQAQKDEYHMISLLYEILKSWTQHQRIE